MGLKNTVAGASAVALVVGCALAPSAAAAPEPVVGSSSVPNSIGLGHAKPPMIYLGGSPSGTVKDIKWQSWGGGQAIGQGQGYYVPRGAITADGYWQPATVVAHHLGVCNGRSMYKSVTWYFPTRGEKFRESSTNDCAGY